MTKASNRFLFAAVLVFLLVSLSTAQNSPLALDNIVQAHRAGAIPPTSIEMIGKVERNGKTEPVRILATREEELRIDYGTEGKDSLILSQKLNFRDDGKKVSYQKTPAGFSQLDVTGLFLIQQLRNRAVRVEVSDEGIPIGGVPTRRIRVQSERNERHKGTIRVDDRVDLYVTQAGILAGVARSFYEGRPERYTQAFSFFDYRETDGVLLPYRVEVYLKGKRVQTFFIEKYQFDVRTDRELFISRRSR